MNDTSSASPLSAVPALPVCPPEVVPNVDDLVIEDGAPADSWLTEKLMRLLTEPLYCSWNPGRDFVVSADVGLFFTAKEPPLVPDVMLSLDIRVGDLSKRQNLSYFVWIVGKVPEVVIEIVSNREGGEDDRKLHGYARMGIPYYVIYDPDLHLSRDALRAFALQEGKYEPISADWLPRVGLGLKLWQGAYEAHERTWLRWCDQQGNVIPTGAERAARLAQALRDHGIDPDKI